MSMEPVTNPLTPTAKPCDCWSSSIAGGGENVNTFERVQRVIKVKQSDILKMLSEKGVGREERAAPERSR